MEDGKMILDGIEVAKLGGATHGINLGHEREQIILKTIFFIKDLKEILDM